MGAFCSPDLAPWTPCWLVQVGNCRSASVGNHLSRLLRCRGSSDESKRGNFCDSIYTPKKLKIVATFHTLSLVAGFDDILAQLETPADRSATAIQARNRTHWWNEFHLMLLRTYALLSM